MKKLNFTHWNQDYLNALSDDDYNLLKSTETELTICLNAFLDAYDIRPDEYLSECYVRPLDLSPGVFSRGINEKEFCVKFDEHILHGVKLRGGGRYQVGTSGLGWIKLGDVPRVIDRYSDSIYQDKTPAQLYAVNQLVTKQREYMTMIDNIENKPY